MDSEDLEIGKITELGTFWDSAHSKNKSFWTSSTPFDYLNTIFMFNKFDLSTRILVVGIGTGSELVGLKSLGFTQVHGVDISKVALENLKEFKVSSWEEIKGKYGLVISHLVAQHTSNKDLLNELNTLRKHLVRRGGANKNPICIPVSNITGRLFAKKFDTKWYI